jgi:hypothetical protein
MAPLSQRSTDVRPSRAWAFALLAITAVLVSCSAGPGEDTASCTAGTDSDGDGFSGCHDPDCHRFEYCRAASSLVPDGGEAGTSGRDSGTAGTRPPTGGMTGGMPSGGNGGNGGNVEEDGGADPDAGSMCSCAANELCSDGGCVPIVPVEPLYRVRMISAQSPKGTLGPPPDGVCVEIACRSGGGSPVSYCPCEPEPYVRVIHISQPAQPDPIETIVLSTKIQGAMLEVIFDADETADIALKPGDALRFELWDQNMTVADSFIHDCDPMLKADLTPGPLECFKYSGPAGLEEFWIRATLEKL